MPDEVAGGFMQRFRRLGIAMRSPMPPLEPGSVAQRLLSDPPGFDRPRLIPELNSRIAEFFVRTLVASP
jgi:hypothetical protein